MAGVEQENGKPPAGDVEEEEMSEDGSVDIEGESEDELEEEEEEGAAEGGEAANGDAMEVDAADKSDKPAPTPATQPVSVAS
jgi:histone chaperone ASF1